MSISWPLSSMLLQTLVTFPGETQSKLRSLSPHCAQHTVHCVRATGSSWAGVCPERPLIPLTLRSPVASHLIQASLASWCCHIDTCRMETRTYVACQCAMLSVFFFKPLKKKLSQLQFVGWMLCNRGVCHLLCEPKCPNTHIVMGAGFPHPGNWGLVISAQQK